METLGDRIKQERLAKKMSQEELGNQIGVGKSSVSQWENGLTKKMDGLNIVMTAKALGVSPEWLALGEGAKYSTNLAKHGFVRFQRLSIEASAGNGKSPNDYHDVVEEIDVLESWARQSLGTVDSDRVKLISCKGDSMSPTIQPDDIVFVDVAVNYFQSEGVYVLVWQDRLLIKRLRALIDGRIAIQSDNQEGYETEYVSASQAEQLAICGKVLGWWTLRKY